jgi:hypothetical protein
LAESGTQNWPPPCFETAALSRSRPQILPPPLKGCRLRFARELASPRRSPPPLLSMPTTRRLVHCIDSRSISPPPSPVHCSDHPESMYAVRVALPLCGACSGFSIGRAVAENKGPRRTAPIWRHSWITVAWCRCSHKSINCKAAAALSLSLGALPALRYDLSPIQGSLTARHRKERRSRQLQIAPAQESGQLSDADRRT